MSKKKILITGGAGFIGSHLGEYSRVEQSFDDIKKVWKSNKDGIFSVLEFVRNAGCKIVYAGSSTKFGDAAFFMNLNNPESLAEHLITIKSNHMIVNEKIDNGLKVLANWDEEIFYKKLISIFKEYSYIRELWD